MKETHELTMVPRQKSEKSLLGPRAPGGFPVSHPFFPFPFLSCPSELHCTTPHRFTKDSSFRLRAGFGHSHFRSERPEEATMWRQFTSLHVPTQPTIVTLCRGIVDSLGTFLIASFPPKVWGNGTAGCLGGNGCREMEGVGGRELTVAPCV